MIFAFDVDGVIFSPEHNYHPSRVGKLVTGCLTTLKWIKLRGHQIVIHSCRTNPEVNPLNHWGDFLEELIDTLKEHLVKNSVPFDRIAVFKPIADWYFDDRANFTCWEGVKQKILELEKKYEYSKKDV